MAYLRTCVECKKKYTSNLDKCPHCNSRGERSCFFCSKYDKVSNMHFVGYGRFGFDWGSFPDQRDFACNICLRQIIAESPKNKVSTCPTCSSKQSAENSTCANCGEFLGSPHVCLICGAEILASEEIRYKDPTVANGYHKFCASKKSKLVEKKPRCFIATATFGSVLAPEVIILSEFRDEILLKYKIGKVFIQLYYFISPPIALVITNSTLLKKIIRVLFITPIIPLIKVFRKN